MIIYCIDNAELGTFGQEALENGWETDFIFDILYLSDKNCASILSISWEAENKTWEILKNDQNVPLSIPAGQLDFSTLSNQLSYLLPSQKIG